MQTYNTVYCDKHSKTIQNAIYTLNNIHQSVLCYRQNITCNTQNKLNTQYPYIKYSEDIIYISFPPEAIYITNIQNSANCKMITEYYDDFIQEIQITRDMHLYPSSTIIMYNRKNTVISFDIYLYKPDSKL